MVLQIAEMNGKVYYFRLLQVFIFNFWILLQSYWNQQNDSLKLAVSSEWCELEPSWFQSETQKWSLPWNVVALFTFFIVLLQTGRKASTKRYLTPTSSIVLLFSLPTLFYILSYIILRLTIILTKKYNRCVITERLLYTSYFSQKFTLLQTHRKCVCK